MRAREFIFSESKSEKMPHYHTNAMSHNMKFPQMDNNYEIYRFGVTMAGSPQHHKDHTKESPVGETPWVIAYSEGEREIIDGALKKHKYSTSMLKTGKSIEQLDTQVLSPVAKRKKNRYGV